MLNRVIRLQRSATHSFSFELFHINRNIPSPSRVDNMYNNDKHEPFHSTLKSLNRLFHYPTSLDKISRWKFFIILMLSRTMFCLAIELGSGLHLFFTIKDRRHIDVSEDFTIIAGGLGSLMTTILFSSRYMNWSDFFKIINNFDRFSKPDTFAEVSKRLNLYSKIFFWYCTIGLMIYISATYIESSVCKQLNEEKELHEICWSLFPLWLPFNNVPLTFRNIIFLIQIAVSWIFVTSAALICFLTWESTEILITHIVALRKFLSKLHHFKDMELKAYLRFCIEYHNHIIRMSEELNHLVKVTVGHVSVIAALVFGSISNQILKTKPMGASIFLIGWVVALFLICHAGQRLTTESLKIGEALYSSEWYILDTKTIRDIAFIIFRSQIPIKLDAIPMGTLNYPLYVMVVKTSYSYLTLLNQST